MRTPQRERTRVFYAVAALLCAAVVFSLLFFAYTRRFDRTLMEENRSRLEEVSGHVAAYIERAVEQQFEELRVVAAASASAPEGAEAFLGRMAEELGFAYIGVADADGLLHAAAFRQPQDISREMYFRAARAGEPYMTGLERRIFWDQAVSGVILSVPGPEGTAVVAMLSTEKMGLDVQVDSFEGNGFTYIIDEAGDQVLHAKSLAYNNLFQALENMEFLDRYQLDDMRADIAARRAGMTAYCDLGVEKYAYYRPLRVNGWTVVTIVPKGVVTARTSALSRELIALCLAAALVFVGLLSAVGVLLLRLESRRRANRAKSDFLANMSHDMRTPMNAMIGMAVLARAHADEPDTVRDCMRKIDLSGQHLLGLINDVLDMSRIESGKMTLLHKPFTLSEVLEGVVGMTYPRIHGRGQRFAVRLHRVRHEDFVGDSLRLSQIFVNILTNAAKFTPEGGEITVDVEEQPPSKPGCALFCFTFTDSGIGMKPEFLKEIFTPFTRERSSRVDSTEGSGLGMAITARIVELMEGRITVASTEGKGSVFTVTLPLPLGEGPALAPPAWRVLLAGGEPEAVEIFTAMDLPAAWAPGLDAAARRVAAEEFQAVFVDRSVYEAGGVRRLHRPDGPALFLAAYDWEDVEKEASEAGIRYFVQKPLLCAPVSRALRKAAGLDGPAVCEPPADLTGKRILMAEDNELNAEIARSILEEAGARVRWEPDGAACVSAFEAAPEGAFDLILMDIQMPRMNGYEATARIRSLRRADASVPILAMSANAYAEDIAAAAKAGMDGYLTKPIDLPVWMAEIRKSLRL